MAEFQINYNNGKGKIGEIKIDLEPEQNDLNNFTDCDLTNFYNALEEKDFNMLEIFNDLSLRIQNLENKKVYDIKDDGSGLEQRR